MTSSGQIEIRSYGLPLVRFKRWLLNRCLPYFRETCLSYIPGTRQFRCRYRRQIAREAIKGLKLFKELQALDFEAKRRLGYQVRKYENQWAVMFVGRRRIATVSALIFLIIVAVIAIYSLPSNIAQAYLAVPTIIEKIGWASFTINMLIIVIAVVISFLLGLVVIPAIVQWYPRFILPLLSLVSMLLLGIPIYLDISTGKHPWDVASSIFPLNHSIPLALSTSIIIFFSG
jgi:hypothetical protein